MLVCERQTIQIAGVSLVVEPLERWRVCIDEFERGVVLGWYISSLQK